VTTFTLTRAVSAPPAVVFDTITDHPSYPEFTPIRRAVLEREGEGAPNGVGAIRALHVVGPPIRERVLDYRRPERFSYEVLSGVPVKSQVGTVTIAASQGGSVISYHLELEPLVPGTGGPVAAVAKVALGRLMSGVAAEAERRARS
jgi:uncharacterized protein YndB with AHSA1/START domain